MKRGYSRLISGLDVFVLIQFEGMSLFKVKAGYFLINREFYIKCTLFRREVISWVFVAD